MLRMIGLYIHTRTRHTLKVHHRSKEGVLILLDINCDQNQSGFVLMEL